MPNTAIYRRNAEGERLCLFVNGALRQEISFDATVQERRLPGAKTGPTARLLEIPSMTPEQKTEILSLTQQWTAIIDKTAPKTAPRRKVRVIHELHLADKVAKYAAQLVEQGLLRSKKRQESRKKKAEK